MRIRLTDSPPRVAAATRVVFLYEARDPAAGSPRAWTSAVRAAVRAAGFRGKDEGDRGRGSAGKDFLLCGLGKAPASATRWRTALRRADPSGPRTARASARAGLRRRPLGRRLPRPSAADRPGGLRVRPLQVLARPGAVAPAARSSCRRRVCRRGGSPARPGRPRRSPRPCAGRATSGTCPPTTSVRWSSPARRRALCGRHRLAFRALGKKEIERERMGGLLGVNAGSARPPSSSSASTRRRVRKERRFSSARGSRSTRAASR